jgi:hypothetical protein
MWHFLVVTASLEENLKESFKKVSRITLFYGKLKILTITKFVQSAVQNRVLTLSAVVQTSVGVFSAGGPGGGGGGSAPASNPANPIPSNKINEIFILSFSRSTTSQRRI